MIDYNMRLLFFSASLAFSSTSRLSLYTLWTERCWYRSGYRVEKVMMQLLGWTVAIAYPPYLKIYAWYRLIIQVLPLALLWVGIFTTALNAGLIERAEMYSPRERAHMILFFFSSTSYYTFFLDHYSLSICIEEIDTNLWFHRILSYLSSFL